MNYSSVGFESKSLSSSIKSNSLYSESFGGNYTKASVSLIFAVSSFYS